MKSVVRSVKHVRYVLGSMSAVLFSASAAARSSTNRPCRHRQPESGGAGKAPFSYPIPGAAMFETGVRQIRLAVGMLSGRRLSAPAISVGLSPTRWPRSPSSASLVRKPSSCSGGPQADPEARQEFAERGLRRTARRLAVRSPFYARRLAGGPTEPGDARRGQALRAIPVTTKTGPDRAARRLRVHRCRALSEHSNHRHHRPSGRDLAVAV